jgi:alpha-ketoglutarate-dependent taurine dioxygenase
MKTTQMIAGSRLPLLVEPADANRDLARFAESHRADIDARLLESGALLFRGFAIGDDRDFDRAVKAMSTQKMEYNYGSTPRTLVKNRIYTTTEYPAHLEIPLHSELSYHTDWPRRIAFCCITPAEEKGSTPLADLRKVNATLGPALLEEFTRRQVRYLRHFHQNIDVPWQQVFGTEDKAVVDRFCADNDIEVDWLPDGVLRTVQKCQGTARHPQLDEVVMFNQAHLFHASSLDEARARKLEELFGKDRLPRHTAFGDGAEFPAETLAAVRHAYASNAVDFTWEKGDVILIDNMQVAHGRRTFKGKRNVLAALMDPMSKAGEAAPAGKSWWKSLVGA